MNVSRPVHRLGALLTATLGLLACLVLAGIVGAAGEADGKSNRRIVLGSTKNKVTPNCGTRAASPRAR
jgi:hypothetical protein